MYTTKVYFINPVDLISVVINTLVELEYETYSVSNQDRDRLLKVLQKDPRNIVFISITNKADALKTVEYVEALNQVPKTSIQIGSFVYNNLEPDIQQQLLLNKSSITPFSSLQENTVAVLKRILQLFEANTRGQYVQVRTRGITEVYFMPKSKRPFKARVIEISSFAFVCEIVPEMQGFFRQEMYIPEVTLILQGARIQTAAKVLGFSKTKNAFIFRFCELSVQGGKMTFSDTIARQKKIRVHNYIRACLGEDMAEQLSVAQEQW